MMPKTVDEQMIDTFAVVGKSLHRLIQAVQIDMLAEQIGLQEEHEKEVAALQQQLREKDGYILSLTDQLESLRRAQ